MTANAAKPAKPPEQSTVVWRIELLGGVCLRHQDHILEHFKTRRMTLLLARLACFPNRAHPRDTLAEELWPEEAPDTLRERFRQTLSMLRRELEPEGVAPGSVLMADRSTVRLSSVVFVTDVAEFETACRMAKEQTPGRQIELLQQAAHLYQGELLPGFYEDWILTEREHLAERHRQAMSRLTNAYAALGQFEAAIETARRAVASDPLREESRCALIRVFAQSGRSSDARRQYEEWEHLLRVEMDAEPSASAQTLMEQVRSGELAAKPRTGTASEPEVNAPLPISAASPQTQVTPPPFSPAAPPPPVAPLAPALPLPVSLTRFFGREEEIAHLLSLLLPISAGVSFPQPPMPNAQPATPGAQPSSLLPGVHPQGRTHPSSLLTPPPPLVTLTGSGGAGKTRLALEVARRVSPEYNGAVWFVSLADVAHPALIADALVETLGVSRSAHAAPLEQAIEFLRPYPAALLILDNFEHLQEEGTPLVQTLRQRLPRLSCLVTSRHKLNVDGERDIALPPLPIPDAAETLENLLAYPGIQLFLDRAQAARYSFLLTPDNAEAVALLGQRLEGLPLAIELAAAWAATLAPEQILQRLSRRFDLLVSRRKDVPQRHQSLQAALEGSYQLLPPRLQRLYARLSVFRGGWTLEAAEAIAREEGTGNREQRGQNTRNRKQEEEPQHPTPNTQHRTHPSSFRLHPLPVLDGLAILQERSFVVSEERGAAMRYRLLESLREFGAEQLEEEEQFALSQSHAQYFLALAGEAHAQQRTPNEKMWFDRLEAEYDNLRAAMEWSLRNDVETVLKISARLCGFWMTRGLAREGNEWLQKALPANGAKPNEDDSAGRGIRADALTCHALMKLSLGDYDAGRELARTSLELLRHLEDKPGMARALNTLGAILMEQSNYHEAQTCYEECLSLYRALQNASGASVVLANLGNVVYAQGKYALACAHYGECLETRRALGDRRGIAAALDYLGRAVREQGDYARACALHTESLAMRRELNDKESIALSLNHLGTVKTFLGEREAARCLHEEGLAVAREIGDKGSMAEALSCMGELARLTGDEKATRDYFLQSLAISQELGDQSNLAATLEACAGLARSEEQFYGAAQMMGAADAIRRAISNPVRPTQRPRYEQIIAALRATLGEARFQQAWNGGCALTLEHALQLTKQDIHF